MNNENMSAKGGCASGAKKVILGSLFAILALTTAGSAMAQETDADFNRIQQVKELVEVDVVNTDTGISVSFTISEGPIQPTLHLGEIYAEELMNRDLSARDRINITTESVSNGFAINIDGTEAKFVEKIQARAAGVNFPARINNLLLQFLANHGIK